MNITLETLGKSIREGLDSVVMAQPIKEMIQRKIEDDVYIKPRAEAIIHALKRERISIVSEKDVQKSISIILTNKHIKMLREEQLTKQLIPDFFFDGIAMEVKIKGSARNIYAQCRRYCAHEKVRALILVTSRNMGLPPVIEGKPCYYINLSEAWL